MTMKSEVAQTWSIRDRRHTIGNHTGGETPGSFLKQERHRPCRVSRRGAERTRRRSLGIGSKFSY